MTANVTEGRAPEWKYQRQFDHGEGVSTRTRRASLVVEKEPVLLDDERMRFFLANGYLTLTPQLPASFHQDMFDRFLELAGDDNDANPGNNLLPVVPEMSLIFEDPVVKGALTSVLGDGYMMHPHRVLHDNPPGSDAQVWHHDSYWGYKRKVHNHHPWWVMIMYYPQEIFEKIGPTGVIPGSQCIAQRLEDIDQLGTPAEGQAGTCMMIHYDIWHRKMKNFTNLKRFMTKFEFIRMHRPDRVTWDNTNPDWQAPASPPAYDMEPVWRAHWYWISHKPLPQPDVKPTADIADAMSRLNDEDRRVRARAASDLARYGADAVEAIPALVNSLGDDSEPVGLNAGYALAAIGEVAIPALIEAMRGNDGENVDDARCFIDEGQKSEIEMVARNAAHGLVAVGKPAVPALVEVALTAGPRVRKYASFALGEIDTDDDVVLNVLGENARHPDPAVRINAVEALGLKRGTDRTVEILAQALDDEDDEVRFNAALSLARLGPTAAPAVAALTHSLTDGNRYVTGYALEALERIGTAEATNVLMRMLKIGRWCPMTNNKSLF